MSRKGSIAILFVLAFALCTAGAASALPLSPEVSKAPGETGLLGMWDRFLDWIVQIAAWRAEGCHLDPNGTPICPSSIE